MAMIMVGCASSGILCTGSSWYRDEMAKFWKDIQIMAQVLDTAQRL